MKPSGIGGMAVMEGVMMKNKEEYAVAVRMPNNEITVEKSTHKDFSDKAKLFKLPIFRGILAFVDSLVIGLKVLNYSASFFEEEEEETASKKNKAENEINDFEIEDVSVSLNNTDSSKNTIINETTMRTDDKEGKKDDSTLMMVFAVLISIVLSVALFMVLPVVITNLFTNIVKSNIVLNLVEGILRLAIFIGYVILAAKMPEIKRVFMYHGAEHKTINCLENGFELTVENVKWQSKLHKRCGTSFMLLVILISLVLFMIIPSGNLVWRILSRVVLIPFIAGISYEFIRLAGKSENKVVDIISKPGLWMQSLTTKEPDDSMIEVAIESVGAVFNWKEFLETSKETKKDKNTADRKKSVAEKKASAPKQTSIKQTNEQIDEQKQAKTQTQSSELKPENDQKQINTEKKAIDKKTDINSNEINQAKINPVQGKPSRVEEEDDEILKALDKYFDDTKGSKKAADGN